MLLKAFKWLRNTAAVINHARLSSAFRAKHSVQMQWMSVPVYRRGVEAVSGCNLNTVRSLWSRGDLTAASSG